jgi:hypothetical protein
MITVKYYNVKVCATFNCAYERIYEGPLNEVMANIVTDMKLHNFCEADVVDFFTGEIIAEVKN